MTNMLSLAINVLFATLLIFMTMIYMDIGFEDLSMDHINAVKYRLLAIYYEMKI